MKIIILTLVVSSFVCSYATIVHADTQYDTSSNSWLVSAFDDNINANEILTTNVPSTESEVLNSASAQELQSNEIIYSSWELIHRIPMMAGFLWVGEVANFITPNMFLWTPFGVNPTYLWKESPYISEFTSKSTTYKECVINESYLSFGLGDRINTNDIDEFKAIAKVCSKTFYGAYFDAKAYTTREEFLMMMFTLFGEVDVWFQWQFWTDGIYTESNNDNSETGFNNVSPKSWYASYLKLANGIGILSINETTTWQIEQEINNTEAVNYLWLYTASRMSYQWDTLERGSISTEKIKFNLTFLNEKEIAIRAQ